LPSGGIVPRRDRRMFPIPKVAQLGLAAEAYPTRRIGRTKPLQLIASKGRNNGKVKRDGQIVESAREARQAERGRTVRNVLVASTILAVVALAIIWFVFFRT
jgi:hypothetical protein